MKPEPSQNDAKNTAKGVFVTVLIIVLVIFGAMFIMFQSCAQGFN